MCVVCQIGKIIFIWKHNVAVYKEQQKCLKYNSNYSTTNI